MARACGNPRCSTSTGMHGGLTYGSGDLYEDGYWEFPCDTCARYADAHSEELQHKMMKELGCDLKYLQKNHDWLFIEAWPFKKKECKAITPSGLLDLINDTRVLPCVMRITVRIEEDSTMSLLKWEELDNE